MKKNLLSQIIQIEQIIFLFLFNYPFKTSSEIVSSGSPSDSKMEAIFIKLKGRPFDLPLKNNQPKTIFNIRYYQILLHLKWHPKRILELA